MYQPKDAADAAMYAKVPQLFSRVSPDTDTVLVRAAGQATSMHHAFQGPEHILLGFLVKNDNPMYDVLRSFGITYESVRPIVEQMHLPVIAKRIVEKYTQSVLDAIKEAITIAERDTMATVAQPKHLLAALLLTGDINVAQVFDSLRVDRDALLAKVIDPSILAKH